MGWWAGQKHCWGEFSLYWSSQNTASTQYNKWLRKKERWGELAYMGACMHVCVCVCVYVYMWLGQGRRRIKEWLREAGPLLPSTLSVFLALSALRFVPGGQGLSKVAIS